MASMQETFAQRQNETAGQINNLYNKQEQAQAANLKTEFDRNMSNAQAGLQQIAPQYKNQANTLAGQFERQRRNANLSAMTSGLGSGTGQQQQNAMRNAYVGQYAGLRGQEAGAVNEANQKIADLTRSFTDAQAKLRAETEAKRDQSLIEAYNQNMNRQDAQAANLAKYGNFDAYKQLYGEAQANQMRNTWIAQNPDVALRSGMISKEDYTKMTGKSADIDPVEALYASFLPRYIQYQSIYD
jgi:hypothetical protein